jgi:hypothetical protein
MRKCGLQIQRTAKDAKSAKTGFRYCQLQTDAESP